MKQILGMTLVLLNIPFNIGKLDCSSQDCSSSTLRDSFIICSGRDKVCESKTIECLPNQDCIIECNSYSSCKSAVVKCPTNHQCHVRCTDGSSCFKATIDAKTSSNFTVTSIPSESESKGLDFAVSERASKSEIGSELHGTKIYCPENNDCYINIIGYWVASSEIFAQKSNNLYVFITGAIYGSNGGEFYCPHGGNCYYKCDGRYSASPYPLSTLSVANKIDATNSKLLQIDIIDSASSDKHTGDLSKKDEIWCPQHGDCNINIYSNHKQSDRYYGPLLAFSKIITNNVGHLNIYCNTPDNDNSEYTLPCIHCSNPAQCIPSYLYCDNNQDYENGRKCVLDYDSMSQTIKCKQDASCAAIFNPPEISEPITQSPTAAPIPTAAPSRKNGCSLLPVMQKTNVFSKHYDFVESKMVVIKTINDQYVFVRRRIRKFVVGSNEDKFEQASQFKIVLYKRKKLVRIQSVRNCKYLRARSDGKVDARGSGRRRGRKMELFKFNRIDDKITELISLQNPAKCIGVKDNAIIVANTNDRSCRLQIFEE